MHLLELELQEGIYNSHCVCKVKIREPAEFVASSRGSMGRVPGSTQAQGKLSAGELTAWKETLHEMHTARVAALAQH